MDLVSQRKKYAKWTGFMEDSKAAAGVLEATTDAIDAVLAGGHDTMGDENRIFCLLTLAICSEDVFATLRASDGRETRVSRRAKSGLIFLLRQWASEETRADLNDSIRDFMVDFGIDVDGGDLKDGTIMDELTSDRSLKALATKYTNLGTEAVRDERKSAPKAVSVRKILNGMTIRNHAWFMLWCAKNNVKVALTFLFAAPHMRFEGGDYIRCLGGAKLGRTFYAFPDTQVSRDAQQKMIYAHFTIRSRSVVYAPRNLYRVPAVYIRSYKGGAGHNLWRHNDADLAAYEAGQIEERDLFCMAVDPRWTPSAKFLDITGDFDPRLYGGSMRNHYPSARVYAQYWGWQHFPGVVSNTSRSETHPKYNTVCWHGAYKKFQPRGSNGGGDIIINPNTGHLGDMYPGCADVRCGMALHKKEVNYKNTSTFQIVA